MSVSPNDSARIAGKLDELARRGARHLRRWEWKQAVEASLPRLFPSSLVVPGLLIVSAVAELAAGVEILALDTLSAAWVAVAFPVVVVLAETLYRYTRHAIDRRMALAFFDRELGLKDRLQAADEFRAAGDPTVFERAAIADAAAAADLALSTELKPPALTPPTLRSPGWGLAGIAVVLLGVALLLGPAAKIDKEIGELRVAETGINEEQTPKDPTVAEEALAVPELERTERIAARSNATEPRQQSGESQKEGLALDGMPSAQSLSAGSQSGMQVAVARQSKSSGSPSGGAEQSSRGKDSRDSQNDGALKKPRADSESADQKNQETADASGVNGGKGSNPGGKNNPVRSDQVAAQNKSQQNESSSNGADARERKNERQQATAGQRGSLDRRRAAADRGNAASGNTRSGNRAGGDGRGGAGGVKKTRGVAAMLLAVPLPDHLQGTPNPGRSKTIREQSQPEETPSDVAAAADRGRRQGSVGHVAHPDLLPWMQDLVEAYFLTNRVVSAGEQTGEQGETGS